ncbi:MAG TPA: flippase activity-associated protein Agl23 [Anaerolineae bacterium]|nr:flippase activity-associated protein Agl23 [Anaerolineae bacterium]
MELEHERAWFDRPLAEILRPNFEKVIYVLICVLAVVSRFWDLGARAMSHDESLHALYSYYLYSGSGYIHNPMMHGPFLFHANALIYFLFGDNDYTARIIPAIFGVLMVMSPLLLRRWLGRGGAIVASVLLLISPSFLYYSRYIRNDIYITVWTMLLVAALFHFIRSRDARWFYLGAAVLMLSLATKENAYIFGYLGLIFILELLIWERVRPSRQLWLYLGVAVVSILLLAAASLLGQAPPPPTTGEEVEAAGTGVAKLVQAVLIVLGGTLPAAVISASLLRSRHPEPSSIAEAGRNLSGQNWLVAIIVMFLIYALLFTTFFTNPLGLGTGIFGSISYWLAQQEVERGGQPWFYYLLVLPMYEFLPLLFSFVATVYYLIRGAGVRRGAVEPDDEAAGDRVLADSNARFVAFLIFWNVSTLFIYSWAGEKMPWLVVHPALPMIILSSKFLGDILGQVNWREIWDRGGAILALLLPVTAFGLYMLLRLQPFQGLSLSNLQETGNWITALLVTLLLVLLTLAAMRRLGGRRVVMVAIATTVVFLSFFTVRFAWMAAYINYDYATELLVYAHGGADVKPTMEEIAEISQRTVGDKMIQVAYDSDVSWPLEWYMREYPNRKFYGETPTRESMDVPIVLAGDKNDGKVQPFMGERYHRFKRRLVWWPNQQYMDLSLDRIVEILRSPEQREILWDILYYRKYPRTPDDWYHVHNFYVYIRKDVAAQIWDFGARPAEMVELPPDPYLDRHVDLQALQIWGGEVGTEPGMFNHPRGVAVGPEGNVYVVDSDNHRVQVLDPSGNVLRQWGSNCNMDTQLGCVDPDGDGPLAMGDGQFQEPWGIAVDAEGRAYVADTWNHRVQVFDADGTFLTKWGFYGQTATDGRYFYGPRDVAVDAEGRVYVTDTGNKRVVVFDGEGNLLDQWGEEGALPGTFSEPVGIDVATAGESQGNVYIADTWNQRVQVFDADHVFLREWPVDAWFGQSVVNKPFLAVDGQGRVYVTDPEGYRVAVFDGEGELLATFGLYGFDNMSFSLPAGIDVDDEGNVYVADTDGHRVMQFPPVGEQ